MWPYDFFCMVGMTIPQISAQDCMTQAALSHKGFSYTDEDFKRIAGLILCKAGIHLEDRKKDMVYSRLSSRLRALSIDNFSHYCTFVENQPADGSELQLFISALTTNVTAFFREAHHFRLLEDTLQTLSASLPAGQPLMLWSAACSTGEEAYTMAMVARETLGDTRPFVILATDIDNIALEKARIGIYNEEALRDAPSFARRYVTQTGDGHIHVSDVLRAHISFKSLNLIHSWPMRKAYHAVFCRNVMIYFDCETRESVLHALGAIISPGGLLCIGHSENYADCSRNALVRCGPTAYRKESV